jgi:tRNA threonylcarbamoyl adenosine modification protein YeaZ
LIFDENVVVFDTSNQYIAAALYRGKQEVQSIIEFMPRGQAERLMSLLSELLEGASLDWPDISKIGVCTGPGNFTGIRIAVSAARGLALGLEIPAIGISSFEATLLGYGDEELALLPANEGFYYVGSGPKNAKFLSEDEIDSDSTRYVYKATPEIQLKNIALLTIKKETDFSRPTPCYIKPADAAPSSSKVPNLLK